MDREELLKVHAALGAALAPPESIRELLAKWLETAKPNGRDPHPPVLPPTPRPAKTRRRKSAFSAKTAERKLLEAMRDNPGLSVIALANAAGSSRSATGERLRQLALRDLVEKDATGRWKLKGEGAGPPAQGEALDPTQPSPN
jgi:Winged helix-turn-helix DNA-binding